LGRSATGKKKSPHENEEYLKYFISEIQKKDSNLSQHRRKFMDNIKLCIKEREH